MGKHVDSLGRTHVGDLSPIERNVWAAVYANVRREGSPSAAWAAADAEIQSLRTEAMRQDYYARRLPDTPTEGST